ncbi:TIGR03773 family transporter-associated surface protein [Polymorphospora rubra]|uniref:TIGR03773 family transporter-associated surface protein n=1 Tax=Polymorphospora rubra TaxID=338584 RepID=UPI0034034CF8
MRPLRMAAGVLAAVLLGGASPAVAAPPAPRPDLAGADLVSVRVDGGEVSLRLRDARQAARGEAGHRPDDVRLGPDGGLAARVPQRSEFRFLGAAGRPVWALAGGDPALPALDTTGVTGGAVTLALTGVTGPGGFVAYTLSGFGTPTPLLGSGNGLPDRVRLPAGTRTGGLVWVFDTPGDHELTFTASVAGAGRPAAPATATWRVTVPPIDPPSDAPPPGAGRPEAAVPPARAVAPPAVPAAVPAPAVLAATTPAGAGRRKVIDDGHVDMGPTLTDGRWRIRIKDGTVSPPVWRELGDTVLHVRDTAKITVPDGADHAFLGRPGENVWLLPQAQQDGIVWPGWNTQHETVVGGIRGPVTWTLKGVTGPGAFTLFLTGSFGRPQVLFDGTRLPQELDVPLNTHAHGNWGFGAPGVYHLELAMSATTTAGTAVTDTRTLTFAVGDGTDPGQAVPDGGDRDAPGGRLPRTGESWILPAVVGGLVLLGVGVLLVLFGRRRKARAS